MSSKLWILVIDNLAAMGQTEAMNIFILDTNPSSAAVQSCDKHVVKMVLETAQILCSALSIHGIATPYKATHVHHPFVKWTAETWGNAMWLWRYGVDLGL